MNEEIESIKNAWNVPVTVMFSNSEMGSPTGGNLEMHKIKADAIALKEKKLFVQAAALLLLGSCCVALFSANKALGN
ncbi:MAG TPA: hypothetical protein PKM63_11835 [Panacibacter sp.]|nr:hypothetical protein [Panacibacter sp.]HNP44970.1 hypothetical protein [Panacibacter sp.]